MYSSVPPVRLIAVALLRFFTLYTVDSGGGAGVRAGAERKHLAFRPSTPRGRRKKSPQAYVLLCTAYDTASLFEKKGGKMKSMIAGIPVAGIALYSLASTTGGYAGVEAWSPSRQPSNISRRTASSSTGTTATALHSSTEIDTDTLNLTPELEMMTGAFSSIADEKTRHKQLLYMANQVRTRRGFKDLYRDNSFLPLDTLSCPPSTIRSGYQRIRSPGV